MCDEFIIVSLSSLRSFAAILSSYNNFAVPSRFCGESIKSGRAKEKFSRERTQRTQGKKVKKLRKNEFVMDILYCFFAFFCGQTEQYNSGFSFFLEIKKYA